MSNQVKELDSRLTALITRPPPTPSISEDIGAIVASLKPRLEAEMREYLKPMLLDVRTMVEEMLKAQNMEIANSVMKKLSMTLQAVETLQNWATRSETDAGSSSRPRVATT